MALLMSAADNLLGEFEIDPRFNGPETSANGGYACGRVAAFVEAPAVEVTLRLPPALGHRLSVIAGDSGAVRVVDGDDVVAEARPVELPDRVPPHAPTFEEALAARASHPLRGIRHPMSECFVCGPERGADRDGLGVTPGPLERSPEVGAAPFVANESVATDGVVDPAIVWGALDCPSFVPAMWESLRAENAVALLGRLTASIDREIRVGEELAVVGWLRELDGRKYHTSSAILDESGEPIACADATWIRVA
jgi:hypothetical protein